MQQRQWYYPRLTTTTTTRSFSTSSSSISPSSSSSSCCGLSRLLRKLKRCSNKMLKISTYTTSRQSSFQCRYDPLSYALNFDTNHVSDDDEDYYKFCAFSSRFVAAAKPHYHSQTLIN